MPGGSRRWWLYDDVTWGLTLCHGHRCSRTADVLYEGQPLCCDCAELVIERDMAEAESPGFGRGMPTLDDV